jgi:hypothetical protein
MIKNSHQGSGAVLVGYLKQGASLHYGITTVSIVLYSNMQRTDSMSEYLPK